MTEKIRLEIDDATAAGLNTVEKNLADVGQAADKVEKELNQAASAAKKLGDDGAKDAKSVGLKITELNQGLELAKKGFELASRAIQSMAASGNPAAQSLLDSFDKVGEALQKIGHDPAVQDAFNSLAQTVEQNVVPAIGKVPGLFADTSQWLAKIGTQAAEFTGFFPEGTTESLAEDQVRLTEIAEAQRKINEEKRIAFLVTGKSEEIEARVAADNELRNIAKLDSERSLKDLLDLEIEARQELADKGELSGKKLAESDKRLELIHRRLADLVQIRADADSKAANQIADARIKELDRIKQAEQDGLQAFREGAEENARLDQERLDKATEEANAAADQLLKVIEQAKGASGKGLLDEARSNLSPEQVRAQLVKKAQDEARQNVKLEGDDPRLWAAQSNKAAKQAGVQAFRDFNAGKTSEADIVGAQNTLINSAAQAAQGRGQLDQQTVDALSQAAQNQQQIVQAQQQQAQVIAQIQAALGQAGQASRNTFANGRRMANSR